MNDLIPKNQTQISNEQILALDESIVEELTSRNNKKQRLTHNTKKVYKTVIRAFNQFLTDHGLTVNQESVKAYFDSIKDTVAPSTLNHKKYALLKVIKAQFGRENVLQVIAIEKVFESIPSYQIDKTIKDDKYLSEWQIKQMIEASTPKTGLIIHFLFKTGCRVSEMINIRLSDCDVKANIVPVRIIGKGRKVREVEIPKLLYDAIRQEYAGTKWLFESQSGAKLDRRNVWLQIKRAGRRIGLSDVHPHIFRHSRATDMIINKGVSIKATSLWLGHSGTSITLDMYVKDKVNANDLFSKDLI